MRIVVQVVQQSSVTINETNQVNKIADGLNLLVGFSHDDTKDIALAMAKKIAKLRVIYDENNKMNLSILDTSKNVLSISQFTLYADTKKGNRPSFTDAMNPEQAKELYEYFNSCLKDLGLNVAVGVFGADMIVDIVNVGPVTILLDSDVMIKK